MYFLYSEVQGTTLLPNYGDGGMYPTNLAVTGSTLGLWDSAVTRSVCLGIFHFGDIQILAK